MAESDMRRKLVQALAPLDAMPVENRACPGSPDVEFIGGWIECKWLRHWPKRATTVVRLDHPLLPTQKVWLRRRCSRGGKAWVMLQCRREWLLFDGYTAAEYLGNVPRSGLYLHAKARWENGLDEFELREALRNEP